MSKILMCRAGLAVFIALVSPTVHAEPDGIIGYSTAANSPPNEAAFQSCFSCHSGGTHNYTVSISGSTLVATTDSPTYTINANRINGTAAVNAGFNLSATGGALLDTDANSHIETGQLTHDFPESPSGTNFSWGFGWTPGVSGSYTFNTCVNLVNGNRDDPDGLPPFNLGEDSDAMNGTGEDGDNPRCGTLSVTVNNPPTMASFDATPTFTEDVSGPVIVDSAISPSDTENSLILAEMDLSTNYMSTEDRLVCPATSLTCSFSTVTGTLTLSGPATVATYDSALQAVTYNNLSDAPNTSTRTVTLRIRDALNQFSNTQNTTINVVATNDVPVISNVDNALSYTELDPATVIDGAITITDLDNNNMVSAEVEIVTNHASTEDALACTLPLPSGIASCTFNSMTGVLSLAGTATKANYELALEGVTYVNSSGTPSTLVRTVAYRVNDGGVASTDDTTTVAVSSFSFPPTVAGFSADVAFTENTPLSVDAGNALMLADPDGINLNQAELILTTNFQASEDDLVCPTLPIGNIDSCSFVATAVGTLLLNSGATSPLADFVTAIRAVNYSNSSENPNVSPRTLTLRVLDDTGTFSTPVSSKSVTITRTNDQPVAVNDGGVNLDAYNFPVNTMGNIGGPYTLNVLSNDSDIDTDPITITATGTDVTGSQGGTIVVNNSGMAGNDISYTPPTYTPPVVSIPDETFIYTIEDIPAVGVAMPTTATVTIKAPDTDGDNVVDFLDNCAATPNGTQADNDADEVIYINTILDPSGAPTNDPNVGGDLCDLDDDNDGMPDTFETMFGLDKNDPADALIDTDGDGVNNLNEFLGGTDPTVDDVPPVLTLPADLIINSTGYLTSVDLGSASASDFKDGDLTPMPDQAGPFRPGHYDITWSAVDATSNTIMGVQSLDVVPLINLDIDQVIGESGQVATVTATLNGAAANYDVVANYTLSGTATVIDDYITTGTGTFTISSPNTSTSFNIVTVADVVADDGEEIVISLNSITNAVPGANTTQTITITETNVLPVITLAVLPVALFTDTGIVTVTATVNDANGDTPVFDWSATDNSIFVAAGSPTGGNTLTFDPTMAMVPAGTYNIVVSVTDNVVPVQSIAVSKLVVINNTTMPTADDGFDCDGDSVVDATNTDCDGDGTLNLADGLGDADGDGIADYLDSISETNALQNQTGLPATSYVLETENGLSLGLGSTAIASGISGALILDTNVVANGGSGGGVALNASDTFSHISGLFNFEISGLSASMESAYIVLPLTTSIQANSVYRKFINGLGWFTFVVDDRNKIYSAAGAPGICPAPGSAAYVLGLSPFHYCVQLLVQDGGPNDADGLRNFIIVDPGGVAIPPPVAAAVPVVPDGRVGVVHPLLVLLIASLLLYGVRRRKRFAE